MRIILVMTGFILAGCSVENITDRNSGVGIGAVSAEAGDTVPAGATDYRGQLMEELAGS